MTNQARQTLGQQVADAQRTVAGWSPAKRASVQLEGGRPGPESYRAYLCEHECAAAAFGDAPCSSRCAVLSLGEM